MTAAELEAKWVLRDRLYANRRAWGTKQADYLTEDEVRGIVWWRRLETSALPSAEKVKALTALSGWKPPIARQF